MGLFLDTKRPFFVQNSKRSMSTTMVPRDAAEAVHEALVERKSLNQSKILVSEKSVSEHLPEHSA